MALHDRAELRNLKDLDRSIIEEIAQHFIEKYGRYDVDSGEPIGPTDDVSNTMGFELRRMMLTPELGLRQVVPIIAMWVDTFNLDFDDELFQMERRRLEQRQKLADELQRMAESGEPVTLRFSVADILSELELEELPTALPYIEAQITERTHLPPEPETVNEVMQRLRNLWSVADEVVEITLTPDALKNTQQLNDDLDELWETEEDFEVLKKRARAWLDRLEEEKGHSMSAFFNAFNQQTPSFQMAIKEVMEENIRANTPHKTKASKTVSKDDLPLETRKVLLQSGRNAVRDQDAKDYEQSYHFFRRLLTKLFDWWIFRR